MKIIFQLLPTPERYNSHAHSHSHVSGLHIAILMGIPMITPHLYSGTQGRSGLRGMGMHPYQPGIPPNVTQIHELPQQQYQRPRGLFLPQFLVDWLFVCYLKISINFHEIIATESKLGYSLGIIWVLL